MVLRPLLAALLHLAITPAARAEDCPPTPTELEEISIFGLRVKLAAQCEAFKSLDFWKLGSIESKTVGLLTPYWHRELIGADLAAESLHAYRSDTSHPPIQEVSVAIIDGGLNVDAFPTQQLSGAALACKRNRDLCRNQKLSEEPNGISQEGIRHGTSVAHLIAGDPSIRVSEVAKISDFFPIFYSSAITSFGGDSPYTEILKTIADMPDPPKVLNISMSLGHDKDTLAQLKRVEQRGVIIVAASGNDYLEKADENASALPGLLVGSVSGSGLESGFSQRDEHLAISAPSNQEVQSISHGNYDESRDANPENFGGTSGASPIVAGSITYAISLLPGITRAEIAELLRRTAIETSAFRDTHRKRGAGVVNTFKLAQVALDLRKGWPRNRKKLFSPETYNYNETAKALYKSAHALLAGDPDCQHKIEAVKTLRKAFFLAPASPTIRGVLAGLYRENGFVAQSNFISTRSGEEIMNDLPLNFLNLMTFKKMGVMEQYLRKAITQKDENLRLESYIAIAKVKQKDSENFMKIGFRDSSPVVRAGVIEIVDNLFSDSPQKLKEYLDPALQDPDPRVRAAAIPMISTVYEGDAFAEGVKKTNEFEMKYRINRDGLGILSSLTQDPDKKVRLEAYKMSLQAKIGDHDLIPMFEQALQDAEADVRFESTLYLSRLNSDASRMKVLRQIVRTQNEDTVRNTLFNQIDGFGSKMSNKDKLTLSTWMLERPEFRKNKGLFEATFKSDSPHSPAFLLKAWKYPEPETRALALTYASYLDASARKSSGIAQMVQDARKSKEPKVLAALAQNYESLLSQNEQAAFIEPLLTHSDPDVRKAAFTGMRALKKNPEKMRAIFEQGLKDPDAEIRTSAFRGLIYSCDSKESCIQPLIREVWKTGDPELQKQSIIFFYHYSAKKLAVFAEELSNAAHSKHEELREAAHTYWVKLMTENGADLVKNLETQPSPEFRRELMNLSDQVLTSDQLGPLILWVLKNDADPQVKIAALHAASRIAPGETVSLAILIGEQDTRKEVKAAAQAARNAHPLKSNWDF